MVKLLFMPAENAIRCNICIHFKQRPTYVSVHATFCDFELVDGHLVISNDWFTVCARNNELAGVNADGGSVGPDRKNKLFICGAH